MTGAEELTALDKDRNVVYTAREPNARKKLEAYLNDAKRLSFEVKDNQIMARKGDIQAAMAGMGGGV